MKQKLLLKNFKADLLISIRKKLEDYQNIALKFKNDLTNTNIKILTDNFTIAILLTFYISKGDRFYKSINNDKSIQQNLLDNLAYLTVIYLSFNNKIGKKIILKVLKNFQSDPEFDELMKFFRWNILVKMKGSKFSQYNLFENPGTSYASLKNINNKVINKLLNNKKNNINNVNNINYENVTYENNENNEINENKTNIEILSNNTEISSNNEIKKMLNQEINSYNKENILLRKSYCQKKLPKEGKKVKSILGSNTSNYKQCKYDRKITIKDLLSEGINPGFNNISTNKISLIQKKCGSSSGRINNSCIIDSIKEISRSAAAAGGSKKNQKLKKTLKK
jgi:hypothetical protein